VARVRLATTEKGYVLQNGTRVPDRTDWHNLVFYRKLAKVVEQYVHKGDKLYVDGRLQYSQYDDKRGVQRMATEIIVDNMEMLTPKSASQPAQSAPSAQPDQQPVQHPQQPANTLEPDDSVVPF
jgi:single-strand DNA-binding protein